MTAFDAAPFDAAPFDAAPFDAARFAAVISPLRRALLAATRAEAQLPELSEAQIDVLRALPRGATRGPAEIAASLRLSRPTVSNLLGAMEAQGLVERGPDPSDGRRVVVRASDRALDLFDRFDTASASLIAAATTALDDDARVALDAALPALERLLLILGDLPQNIPAPDVPAQDVPAPDVAAPNIERDSA